MKVLWFCNTASNAYPQKGVGGGWISSLEDIVSKSNDIELAICFENNYEKRLRFQNNGCNTIYYPIKRFSPNIFRRLYNNLLYKIDYKDDVNRMLQIIEDYEPDLIQIFGSEDFFCKIIGNTNKPIVVHIQGILHKYLEKFLPEGISIFDLLINTNPFYFFVGGGNFHSYFQLKRKAKREILYMAKVQYLIGRTEWDKHVMLNIASRATYFHCEEAIRKDFFKYKWNYQFQNNGCLTIATTINDNIYKGFDLILKTALILKNKNFSFEWNIFGIDANSPQVLLFEKKLNIKSIDVKVTYRGSKLAEELIENLLNSDLFVHPSHIDNSPNSICEAMLLGIPVIATNVGGVSSLIKDNHNGMLVDEYDSDGLAGKIINYSKNDALKLSQNGIEIALKRHNEKSILENLILIYQNILKKSH